MPVFLKPESGDSLLSFMAMVLSVPFQVAAVRGWGGISIKAGGVDNNVGLGFSVEVS